jgi:hypothetical protein
MQVHKVDQVLIFISGKGLTTVAGKNLEVEAGDTVIVTSLSQGRQTPQSMTRKSCTRIKLRQIRRIGKTLMRLQIGREVRR